MNSSIYDLGPQRLGGCICPKAPALIFVSSLFSFNTLWLYLAHSVALLVKLLDLCESLGHFSELHAVLRSVFGILVSQLFGLFVEVCKFSPNFALHLEKEFKFSRVYDLLN